MNQTVKGALMSVPIERLIRYIETGQREDGRPLLEEYKQDIREEIIRRTRMFNPTNM